MNIVAIFTGRPIATTLLAIGMALAGFGALFLMPVAPLPNIDLPVIVVSGLPPIGVGRLRSPDSSPSASTPGPRIKTPAGSIIVISALPMWFACITAARNVHVPKAV